MKEANSRHLQENQILLAVIDENDLGENARHHFLECSRCRGKVALIRDSLQDFGEIAGRAVPPFSRRLKLPVARESGPALIPAWLPISAAAAIAGFAVFFYFMGMQTPNPPQVTTLQSVENLVEDETLMREISELVEYPLPDDLYEITGDDGEFYDDDFLQFAVPDTQDDFQSELITQGGIMQC